MTLGLNAPVSLVTPYANLNGGPTVTESFVTIEQYMTATGTTIVPGSAEEAKIEFQLASSCADIRLYVEQLLDYVVGDTVVLDGTGTGWLLLPQCPVIAVNSIVVDAGLDTETTIDDFKVREAGLLYRKLHWKRGIGNVTVNYDHGFPVMPSNLVNVAVQMVRAAIAVSPGGIVSESIGGYSYSRGTVSTGIDEFKHTLDRYRLARLPAF